jgi:hypothetical protein
MRLAMRAATALPSPVRALLEKLPAAGDGGRDQFIDGVGEMHTVRPIDSQLGGAGIQSRTAAIKD